MDFFWPIYYSNCWNGKRTGNRSITKNGDLKCTWAMKVVISLSVYRLNGRSAVYPDDAATSGGKIGGPNPALNVGAGGGGPPSVESGWWP